MSWNNVSRARPCEICGKPDWCQWTDDGAARCMRPVDPPPGWRAIHTAPDGGVTFRQGEPDGEFYRPPRVRVQTVKPAINWNEQQAEFFQECTFDMAQQLAETLGLQMAVTLKVLGLGWCRALKCWTFPMYSDHDTVVGIRTRFPDGKKMAIKGSTAGIFMSPIPVKHYADPVMVCEGPSDTAAMMQLGYSALGRPSCTGGTNILKAMLAGKEVVIVSDADSPGRRGAGRLAAELVTLCPSVKIIEPPAKDMREWLNEGATRDAVQFLVNEAKGKERHAKQAQQVQRQS